MPQPRGCCALVRAVAAVTAAVITPVVLPPAGALGRSPSSGGTAGTVLRRAPLPLPGLSPALAQAGPRQGKVYGLSAVDDRGRLADRVVWRALGWTPGPRLQIRRAVA